MKDPVLKDVGEALRGKRKNPLIDDIVDKPNLACFLLKTEETITKYQKEEGLPFIPVGKETYFSVKAVHKWMLGRQMTLVPDKEKIKKNGGLGKRSKVGKSGSKSGLNGVHSSKTPLKSGKND